MIAGPASVGAVHELVAQQELFARRLAEPRIAASTIGSSESVWFGVGLSNGHITQGLPVDVLVLVYAQEMLRLRLDYRRSWILVADSNAVAAGLDSQHVAKRAHLYKHALQRLTNTLSFPVTVALASELTAPAERSCIFDNLDAPSPYLALQMAQTEIMRMSGACVKLGWTLSGADYDEVCFDRHYRAQFGDAVSFVYTIGGRTLDPRRPRACPYLCRRPDFRLLLDSAEVIEQKLVSAPASTARGYRRLLGKLARAHRHLTGDDVSDAGLWLQSLLSRLDVSMKEPGQTQLDAGLRGSGGLVE